MRDEALALAPLIVGNAPEARDQALEIFRMHVLGVALTPHHENPEHRAR